MESSCRVAVENGVGMGVRGIDVQVDDVPAAVRLLHRAYGWEVVVDDPHFGELRAGDLRVLLSVEAMVPWGKADGVILHDEVDDVAAAGRRAVDAGAELLLGPVATDWGTEAAYLRGPGNLLVCLYRDVPSS